MLIIKKLMVPIEFQSISFLTMDVFGDQQLFGFSKYLLLCSTKERNSYRFGTTWGWVNDAKVSTNIWLVVYTDICTSVHIVLYTSLTFLKMSPFFPQQSKYKVINKDQWCNVLEFSRTINLDLSNYDEDGACEYKHSHLNILVIITSQFRHPSFFCLQCSWKYIRFAFQLIFPLSSGPVLLDEFVEWYKDREMS